MSSYVVGFELFPIPTQTVERRRGKLVQYVPENIAQKRNLPEYIPLSPERVLVFTLPPSLDTLLGTVVNSLRNMGDIFIPDFALPRFDDQKRVPFDLAEHQLTEKIALFEATKCIGWNARRYPEEGFLEYYWLHRLLTFQRFMIELRDAIIERLNDGIAQAGKELGFSGSIELDGLPTLATLTVAEMQLAAGESSFNEILEQFRY